MIGGEKKVIEGRETEKEKRARNERLKESLETVELRGKGIAEKE